MCVVQTKRLFLFLPFYDYLRLSLINLADLPRILARRKRVSFVVVVLWSVSVFSCQSKRYRFICIHCYGMICMSWVNCTRSHNIETSQWFLGAHILPFDLRIFLYRFCGCEKCQNILCKAKNVLHLQNIFKWFAFTFAELCCSKTRLNTQPENNAKELKQSVISNALNEEKKIVRF